MTLRKSTSSTTPRKSISSMTPRKSTSSLTPRKSTSSMTPRKTASSMTPRKSNTRMAKKDGAEVLEHPDGHLEARAKKQASKSVKKAKETETPQIPKMKRALNETNGNADQDDIEVSQNSSPAKKARKTRASLNAKEETVKSPKVKAVTSMTNNKDISDKLKKKRAAKKIESRCYWEKKLKHKKKRPDGHLEAKAKKQASISMKKAKETETPQIPKMKHALNETNGNADQDDIEVSQNSSPAKKARKTRASLNAKEETVKSPKVKAVTSMTNNKDISDKLKKKRAAKKIVSKCYFEKKPKHNQKGFLSDIKLSPALAAVIGKSLMPRYEVVSKMWTIIKEQDLLDKNDRRFAICNGDLCKLMGVKRFRTIHMMRYLKEHIQA